MATDVTDQPDVTLGLPKWESGSELELIDALRALGIVDLFDPLLADLSAMAPDQVYVKAVIHDANVSVDEFGTEAAAATAVIGEFVSMPREVTLTVDRPFIYLIKDDATGEILFIGRVLDPAAG